MIPGKRETSYFIELEQREEAQKKELNDDELAQAMRRPDFGWDELPKYETRPKARSEYEAEARAEMEYLGLRLGQYEMMEWPVEDPREDSKLVHHGPTLRELVLMGSIVAVMSGIGFGHEDQYGKKATGPGSEISYFRIEADKLLKETGHYPANIEEAQEIVKADQKWIGGSSRVTEYRYIPPMEPLGSEDTKGGYVIELTAKNSKKKCQLAIGERDLAVRVPTSEIVCSK